LKIKKNNLLNKRNTGLLVLLFVFCCCSMLIANISAAQPSGNYLINESNLTDHTSVTAYQDNNDNVYVYIHHFGLVGADQSISIEKVLNESGYGESILKIYIWNPSVSPDYEEEVEYVNTSLSPQEYYFSIIKPEILNQGYVSF